MGIYAESIAQFLTDPDTNAPLSISIQAPWGAGKTSLMRMIQNLLDQNGRNKKNSMKSGSSMKLGDFIKFFSHRYRKKVDVRIPNVKNSGRMPPRVTVWFNPWKYDNGGRLWAGLLDCIIYSIVGRMDAGERELLLLELNVKTNNLYHIYQLVSDTKFFSFIGRIRPWLIAAGIVTGIVVGFYFALPLILNTFPERLYLELRPYGNLSVFFALIVSLSFVAFKIIRIRNMMNNESVDITLDKYIKIPEDNDLNLDHLRLILSAIPDSYRAIVVFVDDLDRCSPNTVSQLIEGINSFFTEDISCIFVIAMDAEAVAAALEVAQSQIVSKLPEYSTQSSLGWKFMDKFVQLPIMLPPFGKAAVEKYVKSILDIAEIPSKYINGSSKDSQEKDISAMNLLEKVSDAQGQIVQDAYEFSNNPRDIKRFVNSLRFYRFMLGRFRLNNEERHLPSIDQIKRWIILSLRWPLLARWLYWSPGGKLLYEVESTGEEDPLRARLKLLEMNANDSSGLRDWQNAIKKLMYIEDKDSPKISSLFDENLRLFLKSEFQRPEKERLSSSAGLGIY